MSSGMSERLAAGAATNSRADVECITLARDDCACPGLTADAWEWPERNVLLSGLMPTRNRGEFSDSSNASFRTLPGASIAICNAMPAPAAPPGSPQSGLDRRGAQLRRFMSLDHGRDRGSRAHGVWTAASRMVIASNSGSGDCCSNRHLTQVHSETRRHIDRFFTKNDFDMPDVE